MSSMHVIQSILQISSPFKIFSPAVAFALGIALIVLSISIIMVNVLTETAAISSEKQALLTVMIAAMTFYGIRTTAPLQQLFSYVALGFVILFTVVVGYIGFRELVLRGVFYNQ